jgi:O-succinylhomoserine sulfhydrylase
MHNDDQALTTRALRAGHRRTHEGEQSEPLFLTSSFVFDDAAAAAARFAEQTPGNIYSRFTNPTVRNFEERLAALEGGERCVATASGMAAILTTGMALLRAGDHVISSRSIFGSTTMLFDKYFGRFGVQTTFVDPCDLAAWEAALRPETRLLFAETPSNPLTEIIDIRALADLAHAHGARLAIDNCFCTPILQRPLEHGADLVIHSATKYLDGQGRCVGGAVVGGRETLEELYAFIRTAGPSMSPFNAWVFLKGLETLGLRMRAHSVAAETLAHWLDAQPGVERVYYPGLASHPQHDLASRQQDGFGGLVSFEVSGGRAAAWAVVDAVRTISVTANLGDVKSTITHPATTTHGRLNAAQRELMGVREGLLRVSVGLEDVNDLMTDLARGLPAA